MAEEARQAGVDGIVCGHIHSAEIRTIGGVQYLNCGDWVESCTALVEHFDGRLELVRWHVVSHDEAPPTASGDGQAGRSPEVAVPAAVPLMFDAGR